MRNPYREDAEVEEWQRRDPLDIHRAMLIEQGFATAEELDALEEEVKAEIEEAVTFARESPYPDPSEVWEDMFADPIPLE